MKILKNTSYHNTTYRRNRKIQYIVIHYTAGVYSYSGCAWNTCDWFKNPNAGGSADFCVDDETVVQYNPDPSNYYTWAVGGRKYSSMSTSLGGTYYNKCTNMNSISVELCSNKQNKKSLGDYDKDWYFTSKTLENGSKLVQELMRKYNIPIENVIMHHHVTGKLCLPLDTTEVLTVKGWKPLGEVQLKEKIVAFNPNTNKLCFDEIQDTVEPYSSLVLKNRDFEATYNHRMWWRSNSKNSPWKEGIWGELLDTHSSKLIPVCGILEDLPGLSLSDDEIRLLVWIQGDGHYKKDKNNEFTNEIEFHLKKERKIDRLQEILKALQITPIIYEQADNTQKIIIKNKRLWSEKYLNNKQFTYNWINLTMEQYQVFFDELIVVDGNLAKKSYCSAIEENLDIIQAIHATHNTRCNKCQTGHSRAVITSTSNYSVGVNSKYTREQCVKERTTLVSCVTVSTGFILIRQGGKPFITGNCPAMWVQTESQLQGWKDFLAMIKGSYSPIPDVVDTTCLIAINGIIREYKSKNVKGNNYVAGRAFLEDLGYIVGFNAQKQRVMVDNRLTLDISTIIEDGVSYIHLRETIDFLNKYDDFRFPQDKSIRYNPTTGVIGIY